METIPKFNSNVRNNFHFIKTITHFMKSNETVPKKVTAVGKYIWNDGNGLDVVGFILDWINLKLKSWKHTSIHWNNPPFEYWK